MKLNNGIEIPEVGLGTYTISPADAEVAVREALAMGYRLVDTANAYVNERAVGRGLAASGVAREEAFVSSKLWPVEYTNPTAVDQTLERLGLDYLDLLFLHQPAGDWRAGYRAIERAVEEGKVRAIGISNFEGPYIEEVLAGGYATPQVIQVEAHPYFTQAELRAQLAPADVKLMSWYPLGHGDSKLLSEPVFAELAEKYGKTPAQVVLRWHVQMGFVVIPGSKNVGHIRDNLAIFGFELSADDMDAIAELDRGERYYHRSDEQLEHFAAWQPEYERA